MVAAERQEGGHLQSKAHQRRLPDADAQRENSAILKQVRTVVQYWSVESDVLPYTVLGAGL